MATNASTSAVSGCAGDEPGRENDRKEKIFGACHDIVRVSKNSSDAFRGILYIIFRIIVYINEKELGQLGQLVLVIRCNRLHLMPLSSCRDDSDMVVVLEHLLGLLIKPTPPEVTEVPDAGICECGARLRTEFRQERVSRSITPQVSRPASPIPPYEDEDEECIVVDDSDVNNDNEGNCPNLNEIMTKEELEMVAAIMEDLPPEVAELMMVDDDAGLNNNNNNLNEIPNEEEEEERAMVARIQLDLPELMLVDDNNNRVVSYEDLIASFVNG